MVPSKPTGSCQGVDQNRPRGLLRLEVSLHLPGVLEGVVGLLSEGLGEDCTYLVSGFMRIEPTEM